MDKVRAFLRVSIGIFAELLGYAVMFALLGIGAMRVYRGQTPGDELSPLAAVIQQGVDVTFRRGGK